MVDAETFLWYVDVIVREGLRQQREHLKQKGGMKNGVPEADLQAKIIVDEAPTHKAFKRGIRKRLTLLEKELHMKILWGPSGYSAVGQPCDQIHRQVQSKEDVFMREVVGSSRDLRFRCEDMRTARVTTVEEGEVDVRAMRTLTRAHVRRAWVVTGYFTETELADKTGVPLLKHPPLIVRKRKNMVASPVAAPAIAARDRSSAPLAAVVYCADNVDAHAAPIMLATPASSPWAPVPTVETKHVWQFSESSEKLPCGLQGHVTAMWAWRSWWLQEIVADGGTGVAGTHIIPETGQAQDSASSSTQPSESRPSLDKAERTSPFSAVQHVTRQMKQNCRKHSIDAVVKFGLTRNMGFVSSQELATKRRRIACACELTFVGDSSVRLRLADEKTQEFSGDSSLLELKSTRPVRGGPMSQLYGMTRKAWSEVRAFAPHVGESGDESGRSESADESGGESGDESGDESGRSDDTSEDIIPELRDDLTKELAEVRTRYARMSKDFASAQEKSKEQTSWTNVGWHWVNGVRMRPKNKSGIPMYKFQSIEQHEKPAVTTAKQEEENRVAPVVAHVEKHARTDELSVDAVSALLSTAKKKNKLEQAIEHLRQKARTGKSFSEEVTSKLGRTGGSVVTKAVLDEVLQQREFNS